MFDTTFCVWLRLQLFWCSSIYICIYIYIYIYIYIFIYRYTFDWYHLIDTKNVGLYRDEGLAVIHQANGSKMDRIRKDIIALFKSEALSITIDTNSIETDFLDISFLLEMDKFFRYKKAEQHPSLHPFWVKPSTFHHQATAIDDQQTYFKSVI